ncbi:MAG TPA: tetratricopeptide repeat protein, partial [Candidatus Aminicenantes bacterium]|nr:tetratricopeptide repeat protein [Candidatus Aminicenantes bacterium]
EVFDAISKAYRTLVNKEKRRLYDSTAAVVAGKEDGLDLSRKADIKFRQGKTLYSQGRYEEALILLEEAVRMRRNKGDYYLLLAMAESKLPEYRKKAEEDFLKAQEMEPWNPEGYVGLGILYKNEDLTTKAARQFQKALDVDSDHRAARHELEELGLGQKKKGLRAVFSLDILKPKKKN